MKKFIVATQASLCSGDVSLTFDRGMVWIWAVTSTRFKESHQAISYFLVLV